jgi:hypothetical protein
MLAMDRKEEGSYKRWIQAKGPDASKLLELPPADFECSLRAWRSYSQNKKLLTEVSPRARHDDQQPQLTARAQVMLRYGTNADGEMERESVRKMLTDLNGGVPPKESALDWVMAEAAAMPHSPGISAPELIKVMSLWYTKDLTLGQDRHAGNAGRDQHAGGGPGGRSGGGPAAPAAPPARTRAPRAETGGWGSGGCSVA